MALVLSNSFGTGVGLPMSSSILGPRTIPARVRVVCESGPSGTVRGSEGNLVKRGADISSFIDNGLERPKSLWWAPLFSVSTEDQWSGLLANSAKPTTEQSHTRPRMAPVNSATTALPELIQLTNERRASQRSSQVAFTAEKARALRKSMRDSETWHDGWYHSAIASRLAEPID